MVDKYHATKLGVNSVMVDFRHPRVLLLRVPEQMREYQRKVTFIKNNSQVEITKFTQFDEWYNKQGIVIRLLEE